jgi:hypothetical protein
VTYSIVTKLSNRDPIQKEQSLRPQTSAAKPLAAQEHWLVEHPASGYHIIAVFDYIYICIYIIYIYTHSLFMFVEMQKRVLVKRRV